MPTLHFMKPLPRLVGVALAAVTALGTASARADTPPAPATQGNNPGFNFGVSAYNAPGTPKRSAFELDAAVGQTLTDRVAVINNGPTPRKFFVYPAGAYNTEVGGGFALRVRSDKREDLASWVTLPVSEYTVPPNTESVFPVKIAVPSDATPGDHAAGIVAEEVVSPGNVQSGAGVSTIHRVAARIYLRVRGPVAPQLTVRKLGVARKLPVNPLSSAATKTSVEFRLANTGNVRAALRKITVSLTGVFGHPIHATTLIVPTPGQSVPPSRVLPAQLLPGSEIRLVTAFTGLPPLDHVNVTVSVDALDAVTGSPLRRSSSTSFWIVPWLALAVATAIVAVALFLRRVIRPSGGPPPDDVAGGNERDASYRVPTRT